MDLLPLAPRARLLFHLQAFVRLVVVWVPTAAMLAAFSGAFGGLLWGVVTGLMVAFAAFLGALWLPSLAFERWGYAVRESDLVVANGLLVRRVTSIPMTRIQHVDMRQGPVEQWLGLARLLIHTASGTGVDAVVPGLEVDEAERLRDRLVERVEGDDGV